LLAWHAVIVVNGTGNRKKPLKISDIMPDMGATASDKQDVHTHRQVLERLRRIPINKN
jgi:hypothetical protein